MIRMRTVSLMFLSLFFLCACGKPQASPEDQSLLASLRTATSAKNMQWLDENAKQIEARHADGKMQAEVYAVLKAIIDKAKAGDWKEADADAYALLQAQKPAVAADADNPDHTHKHGPECAGHAH